METNECDNIFLQERNKFVISSNGISSLFATLMQNSKDFPRLEPYLHKLLLVNPVTNTDTLIKNTANFLFYENLISQEILNQILDLSESPEQSYKYDFSKCQNSAKIIKHVNGKDRVNINTMCMKNKIPKEDDTKYWDRNLKKTLDILSAAKVNIFKMDWLGNSMEYQANLFWPQRSLKVAFINKVISFLSKSNFTFRKATIERDDTELFPSNYLLSNIVNRNHVSKVHMLVTKNFYLSNPFNFYNFVNYEILNVKFGENQ